MSSATPTEDPDLACRRRYMFLARASRRGLDAGEIEHSISELCDPRDGRVYLHPKAFRPTGLALGNPLGDTRIERHLWRIAKLLSKQIQNLTCHPKPVIAFVPPAAYHITLVNRTHFESSRVVENMSRAEVSRAQEVTHDTVREPLEFHLNGLILTREGRFIVPGYSRNAAVFEFRKGLVAAIPELAVELPITTHIKIGHLLVIPNSDERRRINELLAVCGQRINDRIVFRDVSTPWNRIVFGGP
ncbi:MAG: hypothetical protein GY716_04725 [bacterium]|nr:hypothetical protein [bacterium]